MNGSEMIAIDPTVLALLSIFGGAAITVISGFLGALIQSRREHQSWLRNRRFDAYSRVSAYLHEHHLIATRAQAAARELKELQESFSAASPANEESANFISQLNDLITKCDLLKQQAEEIYDTNFGTVAEVMILGPAHVRKAASKVIRAQTDDRTTRVEAEEALDTAMRRALKIRR